MAKKGEGKKTEFVCPACKLVEVAREVLDRNSEFFKRIRQARIEILEGIKSLIESRIEQIKEKGQKGRSVRKIEVSD